MSLPFRMLHRNVMVGHGDHHAAIYRLDSVSYPYLPEQDQEAVRDYLAQFAHKAEADFSINRICRAYPAERYVHDVMSTLDPRHANEGRWRKYLEGQQRHLKGLAAFVPEFYLTVQLRQHRDLDNLREQFTDNLRRRRQRAVILRRDLRILDELEHSTFQHTQAAQTVRRATTREMQWWLHRAASRGLAEPLLDQNWQPRALIVDAAGDQAYQPHRSDLEQLLKYPLEEGIRGLTVQSDEGPTRQIMLTLGHPPTTAMHPGSATELLYAPLEQVPFPVDVAAHFRWMSNEEALRKVGKKVQVADTELEERKQGKGRALSQQAEENTELARELYEYLNQPSQPPMLFGDISFAVGAPDDPPEGILTAEQRVRILRQKFGTVTLHQPIALQRPLYHDHLPRPGASVRTYTHPMVVEQFGALIPHGVHHTGGNAGPYIARVVSGSRRPVRHDLTEATRNRDSPSILISGTLGSGKTITGQLLCLQAALRGSRVVTVDPKNDNRLELLPELEGMVEVMELVGREDQRGRLDPFVIGAPDEREELANDYFSSLITGAPHAWHTQVRKAVSHVLAKPDPCGLRVLDYLDGHSKGHVAWDVGEALGVWAHSGLGVLGFGDGTRLESHALPVTTIRPGGLVLPHADIPRADYSTRERISVATLSLTVSYAMRLLEGDRSVHKVLELDEAKFWLENRDGRRGLDKANLWGRTNNANLILLIQLLGPVGDIEDLIGTRIVHGQQTPSAARAALTMLDLDPTNKALVDKLTSRSFRKGRALWKDLDGRVADVQVEAVYPHIIELLDVNRQQPPPAVSNGHAPAKPRVTLEDVHR